MTAPRTSTRRPTARAQRLERGALLLPGLLVGLLLGLQGLALLGLRLIGP
ncbi:hypothetical protein [Oleisolibacter albus]|nr:hypothetical protein [Oleisolibacter albus]